MDFARSMSSKLSRRSCRKSEEVEKEALSEDASPVAANAAALSAGSTASQATAAAKSQPELYALGDDRYGDWKRTRAACRKNPGSIDSLRRLASDRKLLNWRNPVTGQTLLHELVAAGADAAVVKQAVELGCDPAMPDSRGRTPQELVDRKTCVGLGRDERSMSRSLRPSLETRSRSSASAVSRGYGLESSAQSVLDRINAEELNSTRNAEELGEAREQELQELNKPSLFSQAASSVAMPGKRRKGLSLTINEKMSMPKAKINLDLDLFATENLDEEKLQEAVKKTYGGTARVQIDDVADKSRTSQRSRVQSMKCRVFFDSVEEARSWQERSTVSRVVQETIATNMGVGGDSVQFDAPSKMDETDAVTLKLDSDSSSILCGACLLYDANGECEKVVHYADRVYQGVVRHSGDTQVDGKSVHTISIVQSRIPMHISDMFFTLCSCGPDDLSGFRNPSIMLYDHSEPDANLLEYSIDQAGKSPSCVMAQLSRRPRWASDDRIIFACALRRMGMPFLCVDLCLAMATETSWDVKALGTDDWHVASKICCSYEGCKRLIKEKQSQATSVENVRGQRVED